MGFFEQGMFAPSREFSIKIVSNCFFWASSTFKIFEAGLQSLELLFLGQQHLQDVRGGALVPRIASFGPSGLWSLELSFSAQQCFQSV
jgi:hypothetical protein